LGRVDLRKEAYGKHAFLILIVEGGEIGVDPVNGRSNKIELTLSSIQ